jgi:acyl transferase domain-containing protein/thioesterase domain-containing protein
MSNQDILESLSGTEIAVVGMAGRFPGADNVDTFWQNLRDGKEAIRAYTDEELLAAGVSESLLRNPDYIKMGAPIDNIDMFDAAFFGFSPRDAAIMDPQHRHFLEVCWEGLEHAGYDPSRYEGSIGVFGGSGHNAYMPYHLLTNPELLETVGFFLLRHTGNDKDFLTTRVSYLLDLHGPSVNVQTACSTSLVAIHFGVQSLLNQECDMVLAGGVTFELPHHQGYLYQDGEILSPDGHCRAFDAESKGTVFGSGAGVVVLKRLEDAIEDGDTIHSVIIGSAINNDGAGKVNYLAPSVDGQAGAIVEAIELAGITADTIDYVEAHGTGTRIGDPIEVQALTQAFRNTTDAVGTCGIGSAKTNIGHLDTAAGIAGFIKTTQALKHKQLPPSLNFSKPNPMIDFENSPFYVNNTLKAWQAKDSPRRAGISSLGVGGTNAHIILEEAPVLDESDVVERPFTLLPLSAKTKSALDNITANLAAYLKANPDVNLADVAYTLQLGRQQFDRRRIVAVRNIVEAVDILESGDRKRLLSQKVAAENPDIVFMFPGGGAQYPNMGLDLYETEPVYKEQIDLCLELLKPQIDVDLKSLMFPAAGEEADAAKALQKPSLSLPAVFMTELALAELWLSWGIEPAAMTGHSMGEYTAACLAGVLSVADALSIVTLRGKLFETLPEGGMISVPLPEADVKPLLIKDLNVAVINSPEMCVVSGRVEAIEKMEAILTEKEVESRRIKIQVAAHSAMLDPILEEFEHHLQRITFNAPERPFISNVSGSWADPNEVTTPQYWVTHLRQTVRFADGLETLMQNSGRIFLEVGPGQTLTSLSRQHPAKQKKHAIVSSMRHRKEDISDDLFAYNALGKLWLSGAAIPWQDQFQDEYRRRIPLPTYPFDHQRYWIEPGMNFSATVPATPARLAKLKDIDQWFYQPVWSQIDASPAENKDSRDNWLIFADAHGIGNTLSDKLTAVGHDVVIVTPGTTFTQQGPDRYQIVPDKADDYSQLFSELSSQELFPQHILHLWTVNERQTGETAVSAYHKNQKLGFYSLLYLAQALAAEDTNALQIRVFTNDAIQVDKEAVGSPEKATLQGPVKVIPQEMPGVTSQLIDIQRPAGNGNGNGPVDAQFIGSMLAEVKTSITENTIAYRNGRRWVQSYTPAKLNTADPAQTIVRDGGVYLITGGLGGIALVMAENLAHQARVKLVLTSRSGLPDRSEWDNWLTHSNGGNKTSRTIQKVRALEAAGAEVMVAQADITNHKQITDLLQTVTQKWGPVNGVIHTAGILNDGLMQLKSREEAEQVLQPKVDGTLLLDELLADMPLDFFILFSSTSTVLGPAGQVDYVAANAFLNAFAQSRTARSQSPTIALNWGVWQEVGMAARSARGEFEEPTGTLMPHPLLDRLVVDSENVIEYITDYRVADFWLLDQHRLKNDEALIPGTGYLEIAKAAMDKGAANDTTNIQNLVFIQPLDVHPDETRRVKVRLEKEDDSYAFTVSSQSSLARNREEWTEHVQGFVAHKSAHAPEPEAIDDILARCQLREVVYGLKEQETKQEAYLNFGPRWKNLRRIHFGTDEALAYLELPPEFAADTDAYLVHPALMDLATSFALPLLDGYETSEAFYVPFMYQQVQVHAPLPDKIYSHARYRSDSSADMPVFDVTIYDMAERPLIDIHGFTLKKVEPSTLLQQPVSKSQVNREDNSLLALTLTEGILPAEGAEAFNKVLSSDTPAQIIVSSLDLAALIAQTNEDEQTASSGSDSFKLERPELESDFVAPRNSVEKTLAGLWEELIGIQNVGVHDDFFELGGQSLIAVRYFARIKKIYGLELSLATLFEAPTIADCAEIIVDELGEDILEEMEPETVVSDSPVPSSEKPKKRKRREWSPLVTIEKGDAGKRPFFVVHGAGGNVLNFRDLARYLGKDQPFYGLQAQGVDGKKEPLTTIEEMADLYLTSILEMEPNGPYLLGGYSGGGVIAYEMAQRLQAQDKPVEIVVLFDTFHPGLGMRKIPLEEQFATFKQDGFAYLGKRFKKTITKNARLINHRAKLKYYTNQGLTLPLELRNHQLTNSFLAAGSNYQPQPYSGNVLLFTAEKTAPVFSHAGLDRGWKELAPQLDIVVIPGNHDSLILEPNVYQVVENLRAVLNPSSVSTSL